MFQIPYSLLSLEVTFEMANQISALLTERHADDALLTSILAQLDTSMEMATLAIGASRKQELTAEINAADELRDRCFLGFKKAVEAYAYNDWQENAGAAAGRILSIVKKHGGQLYSEPLTVESALLHSFLNDMDETQAVADVALLGLSGWIEALKLRQAEFAAVYQQRNVLETAKDIPTKQEAKQALVDQLSVLLGGLGFLVNTQAATYGETGDLLTALIDRIVQAAR